MLSQFSPPILVSLNGSAHDGVCQEGNQTGIIALDLEIGWGARPVGQQEEDFWISVSCQNVWLGFGAPHSHYGDNLVVKYPETSTSLVSLGKTKPGCQPLTWEGWG